MNAFMSFFSQLCGNSVLTYYLPSMYTQLGITSTEQRLLLTFMNAIVSCAGAVVGSATNDKIGRRTKLWVGSLVLACLFSGVTAFSSQFGDGKAPGTALSNGGIAMVRSIPSSSGLKHSADSIRYSYLAARTHSSIHPSQRRIVPRF